LTLKPHDQSSILNILPAKVEQLVEGESADTQVAKMLGRVADTLPLNRKVCCQTRIEARQRAVGTNQVCRHHRVTNLSM